MAEEKKEKKLKKGWSLKIKKRCLTIYWQNFMLTASVVMLTLALLGSAFFALTYSYAVDERSEQMQSKATIVSHMVSSYIESGSLTGLRELANFASNVTDAQFLICNTDGDLLLTTDPTLANRVLTMPQEVIDGAMSGDAYTTRTTLGGIYEETHFVVGVPIESNGALVGFVLAVTGARALTTMWRTFIGLFFMTAVTVLLLSFVVSAWVSMRQSRPIHEMAEATRRFADGNFDVRMHNYEGVTEISELTEAFNSMADSLQETERQRREFIANVSHELKTPVAAIQGYLETLLANPCLTAEKRTAFLEKSCAQVARLRSLLADISTVTRMDEASQLIRKERVVLNDIVDEIRADMQLRPEGQRLRVNCDFPYPLEMEGSPSLLGSVFRNLADNAAAYSGGRDIFIRLLDNSPEQYTLQFADNGIGVEEEHLPHIFERFYRIDKGRSRKLGGTGLGLAIVKNAVMMHGGTISVRNSERGGLEFTFTLHKHS